MDPMTNSELKDRLREIWQAYPAAKHKIAILDSMIVGVIGWVGTSSFDRLFRALCEELYGAETDSLEWLE